MAKGYNKAVIMGNLTKDPDVNHSDQRTRTRFTVAVNRTWKDRDGNTHEDADFIPVVAWGRVAEVCGEYLTKGRLVLVEGRIQVYSYEARDGSGRRYATDVLASNVVFLGGAQGGGGQRGDGYSPDDFPDVDESDVPF